MVVRFSLYCILVLNLYVTVPNFLREIKVKVKLLLFYSLKNILYTIVGSEIITNLSQQIK